MNVTLITGTSTGIGLATALHLARRGHRVYAGLRKPDQRGQTLREAIRSQGLEVIPVELDVNDERSVNRAVAEVLKAEGRIDVLINNAGIAPFNPIELATDSEVRGVFETNVFGALRTIRAVLPSMRARKAGAIVNISSVAGRLAPSGMGIYAASKFALEAASEALAREVYSHGIRVVIVEPGIIVTPILGKALTNFRDDPASPYQDVTRRTRAIFTEGQKAAPPPQVVAEVIEAALSDPEPKLRYLAGADAPVLVDGRARMTDEEWIAMDRHTSDEAFFAEFAVRFPSPDDRGTQT